MGNSIPHFFDVIMSSIASQITGVSVVYTIVCWGADQRKHQSSPSLASVREIHRWPVNSLHKGPVTRKIFPFEDVIMPGRFVTVSDSQTMLCRLILCFMHRNYTLIKIGDWPVNYMRSRLVYVTVLLHAHKDVNSCFHSFGHVCSLSRIKSIDDVICG